MGPYADGCPGRTMRTTAHFSEAATAQSLRDRYFGTLWAPSSRRDPPQGALMPSRPVPVALMDDLVASEIRSTLCRSSPIALDTVVSLCAFDILSMDMRMSSTVSLTILEPASRHTPRLLRSPGSGSSGDLIWDGCMYGISEAKKASDPPLFKISSRRLTRDLKRRSQLCPAFGGSNMNVSRSRSEAPWRACMQAAAALRDSSRWYPSPPQRIHTRCLHG
mmetsp:Transcript_14394/g.41116  ORF Transcript_14394/g.41116 Transcript_14394/m.41116 type:complete len:220 (+) Transcript_14394:1253-1912(+)